MRTIWSILLLGVSVDAATYTVQAGGGGNYATIQACATAITSGDTCVVYAGTYNEHVSLSAGGVGAYKTLQVNGTDLVYVYDFTVNSHNKIIGFQIQNPSSPSSANCVGIVNSSIDVYITSNTMYACGAIAMISGLNSTDTSSYVYIQNNTLRYPCSTSSSLNVCQSMNIYGDHHLVENNDISHTSDGVTLTGSFNVFRGNTFHDNTISDCGSHSSNCHIDFIQTEPSVATQYNLIEKNTELNNIGGNGHGYLTQADACNGNCFNVILRFNVGAHVGSAGIVDDNAANSSVSGFSYVKSYNNTWVDYANQVSGAGNGVNNFTHNSTHGSEINDLFYFPESLNDFNPYFTDASTVSTFSVRNNLAYCTGATCNIHGKTYGSGTFTSDPGNIQADPLFVNYAGNDFSLATGSPAINAGTYLTTVAAGDSGSGTSLVVNDASYFQDGSGIPGVKGDCISVTTVVNPLCVTAVNYSTNTLTLSNNFTRSAGDRVWLYSDSTGRQVLVGSAPHIGATFDPPSFITAPSSLTLVVQ